MAPEGTNANMMDDPKKTDEEAGAQSKKGTYVIIVSLIRFLLDSLFAKFSRLFLYQYSRRQTLSMFSNQPLALAFKAIVYSSW